MFYMGMCYQMYSEQCKLLFCPCLWKCYIMQQLEAWKRCVDVYYILSPAVKRSLCTGQTLSVLWVKSAFDENSVCSCVIKYANFSTETMMTMQKKTLTFKWSSKVFLNILWLIYDTFVFFSSRQELIYIKVTWGWENHFGCRHWDVRWEPLSSWFLKRKWPKKKWKWLRRVDSQEYVGL